MKDFNEEVVKNVIYMIRECLNDNEIKIELSSRLVEDLNVDSVDAVCFIMELESLYDISIEDKYIENFTDVASIVRLIQEETKGSA